MIDRDARILYMDLIKKTLSYSLWEDPGMPIETFIYKKSFVQRFFKKALVKGLGILGYQAVKLKKLDESEKEEGRIWPRYAETMIGLKRLDNIQFCIESILTNNIRGDLIETGVWRGGATIFMKAVLVANKVMDRKVFVADSFEGLPKPDEIKYPHDKGDTHHRENFLVISIDEVKNNFKKYGLLDDGVIFLKGWFKDTLANDNNIENLSLLRIDGDMYESTYDVLFYLYPKLTKGGFCIVDDYYALSPCRKAVDDYRKKEEITNPINQIDWSGVYWQK